MGRLEGKVAIITGAGQGIGLGYAKRFLEEGAKVVVAEIDEDRAEVGMKELDGLGEAIFVRTDISDPASAEACVGGGRRPLRHRRRARQQRRALLRHRQRGPELRVPAEGRSR